MNWICQKRKRMVVQTASNAKKVCWIFFYGRRACCQNSRRALVSFFVSFQYFGDAVGRTENKPVNSRRKNASASTFSQVMSVWEPRASMGSRVSLLRYLLSLEDPPTCPLIPLRYLSPTVRFRWINPLSYSLFLNVFRIFATLQCYNHSEWVTRIPQSEKKLIFQIWRKLFLKLIISKLFLQVLNIRLLQFHEFQNSQRRLKFLCSFLLFSSILF